jgi:hypothetical protein
MMEWLKRFLTPRQSNFVELLIKQGDYAVTSVEALQAYFKKQSEKKSTQARQIEKEADEVRRILVHELLDTFVTPIDREDLFALSRSLDNFVDYVYTTVEELEIFEMSASHDVLDPFWSQPRMVGSWERYRSFGSYSLIITFHCRRNQWMGTGS